MLPYQQKPCNAPGSPLVQNRLAEIKVANEQRRARKHVVVIGAGIAGLVATYELLKLGHQVEILEASDRTGGRIWTHKFKNGQFAEMAPMRIPVGHDYSRYYINLLDKKLGRFYNSDPNAWYAIKKGGKNRVARVKRAREEIYPLFRLSKANRVAADKNNAGSGGVYGRFVSRAMNALSDSAKTAFFEIDQFNSRDSWPTIPLDNLSLKRYLKYEAAPDNDQAMAFIAALTALNDLWDGGMAGTIQGAIEGRGVGLQEIIDPIAKMGRMQALPDGIAEKLRQMNENVIELKTIVTSIEVKKDKVYLGIEGEPESRACDYVLCTIPYSAIRINRIVLRGISQAKKHAIKNLTYASSTKVLISCTERFWETGDDPILGGVSISNRVTPKEVCRQTYYPSNHHPFYDRPWLAGDYPDKKIDLFSTPMALLFLPKVLRDHERVLKKPGPGVLLGSYTWGKTARMIGKQSPDERVRMVVKGLKQFHPNIEKYVEWDKCVSIFWDEHKWTRGAFAHHAPKEFQELFPAAMTPEKGRLFFAGEHLSPQPGWIQGALVSSLRAVLEIVEAK